MNALPEEYRRCTHSSLNTSLCGGEGVYIVFARVSFVHLDPGESWLFENLTQIIGSFQNKQKLCSAVLTQVQYKQNEHLKENKKKQQSIFSQRNSEKDIDPLLCSRATVDLLRLFTAPFLLSPAPIFSFSPCFPHTFFPSEKAGYALMSQCGAVLCLIR